MPDKITNFVVDNVLAAAQLAELGLSSIHSRGSKCSALDVALAQKIPETSEWY